MFERIKTGWQLTKASMRIVSQDKEMILYPIFATSIILALAALFFFGAIASGFLTSLASPSLMQGTFYFFIALFLITAYAISIFFEGAIITSTLQRCEGRNPTIKTGLGAPLKKVHHLLLWAVITTIVTVIVQIIRNLGKGKSRGAEVASNIGASTLETGWRLLSFFVIPVILFEDKSVFPALARSKELFVKTWGENITSQLTVSALFALLAFIGIIPLIGAFLIGNKILLLVIGILCALWIIAIIILATTINGILVALLYAYATGRKIPK